MYEIYDRNPNEVLMKSRLLGFRQVTDDEAQHNQGDQEQLLAGNEQNRTIIQPWRQCPSHPG
jgi:hypothetical protein